jgi:hypothetical protein
MIALRNRKAHEERYAGQHLDGDAQPSLLVKGTKILRELCHMGKGAGVCLRGFVLLPERLLDLHTTFSMMMNAQMGGAAYRSLGLMACMVKIVADSFAHGLSSNGVVVEVLRKVPLGPIALRVRLKYVKKRHGRQ